MAKSTRRLESRRTFLNDKFRFYGRGGVIEDSFNGSGTDEDLEEDNFLIKPETTLFFI